MIDQNIGKANSSFNKNILDTSNDYSVFNDFNNISKYNQADK
jgi:hypothetical protein